MPMTDDWTPTTGKTWTVNGREVKTDNLGLSESEDWRIAHTMERQGSEMHRVIRTVAQQEDDATLDQVREALDQLVDWMEAILQGDSPAPEAEGPLVEILQRLDGLEARVRKLETLNSRPPRPQLLQR